MSQQKACARGKGSLRGNAIIEFSLLFPWIAFLFTAVFDFGFYAYAYISVENAARAAVVRNASNSGVAADQASACRFAIEELRGLPNIGQTFTSACGGSPLTVTATYCAGSTTCGAASTSPDSGPAAFVTVTYQMPPLFRMPIRGLSTISRTAEMRLRDAQE